MKRIVFLIAAILLIFMTSACNDEDKPAILFNKNRITVDNVFDYSHVFAPNQRIYYLILLPKKIETKKIEIQIIKKDNEYERLGYTLYWNHPAVLKEDQMYYYDDYVVISETGAYVMQVYSKDNPTKRLCTAPFWVRN